MENGENHGLPRNKYVDQVQEAYENYLSSGDERFFQELIEIVDSKCVNMIREYLRKCGRYVDPETVQDIQQEANFAIWKEVRKTRENHEDPKYTFYWYARGIFRMCIVNEGKTYFSNGNLMINSAVSLDDMPVEDDFVKAQPLYVQERMEDDEALEHERQLFYTSFLDAYLHTLMDSTEAAENCTAVMYMRILPHVLDLVKDSVASSANWARRLIGDKIFIEIASISENKMHENGFSFYRWGQTFMKQLEEDMPVNGSVIKKKNVQYLRAYDNGRDLEHMDRRTHSIVQRETYKNLIKDKKIVSLATEYINTDDRIYDLIRGVR